MNTQTAIRKLVETLGGQNQTAKALGVAQPTVHAWVHGKHGMRAGVALRAERLTGISAESLCPELRQPA